MTDPSAPPATKNSVWAAVVTTAVHGLVWLPAIICLVVLLPRAAVFLADLNMKPPWLTETVWNCGRSLLDWPIAFVIAGIVLVAADGWILWRLSQPRRSGIGREIWSGVVVCTAILALCIVTAATAFPYVKVTEAVFPRARASNGPTN